MKNNPALSSIIVGAIMNIINVILLAILIFTGYIYTSAYVIVGGIAGIISGVKGIKNGQGLFAIIGIVLNVIATLGSIVWTLIYIAV